MGFTHYSGPAKNFPPRDHWKSFDEIFNANKREMGLTGDTGEDIGRIYNAVKECSKIGVESRVIFCIIMQVSLGPYPITKQRSANPSLNRRAQGSK
jgi:hypothetical protein